MPITSNTNARTNKSRWAYININLTVTDNNGDTNLMPNGSIPTMLDKSVDAISNTSTHRLWNPITREWQVIYIRHAPFGMPVAQQRGEKWWLATPDPALLAIYQQAHASICRSIDILRQRVGLDARRADLLAKYCQDEADLASIKQPMEVAAEEVARRAREMAERLAEDDAASTSDDSHVTFVSKGSCTTDGSCDSYDRWGSNDSDESNVVYDSDDSAVSGLGL